jgi:cytochrome oxidase Cu insertion factor (SCO1/SenC/PrrC family)
MSGLLLISKRLNGFLRVALLLVCMGLVFGALLALPLYAQAPSRLKAPEFDGAVGPTLGSDKPIKLKDLRGKIVILEFWTLC